MVRVVLRVGFVLRPVIGDAAHDFLRVIATRKGAFGVRLSRMVKKLVVPAAPRTNLTSSAGS
jgi:hypothetical protein